MCFGFPTMKESQYSGSYDFENVCSWRTFFRYFNFNM